MTGDETARREHGSCDARIETAHGDETTAQAVAAALAPDNTTEMATTVDGERVVTTITRETPNGLHATVDDYVVNLQVAVQCSTHDAGASTADADASQTTTNE